MIISFLFIGIFFLNNTRQPYRMLKNYFKIAWRNLVNNRFSSFINIGGLAVGMAVAILIRLWIYMQEEFVTLRVTHEFGKTTGWKIKEGRDFSRSFNTDTSAFILNEAAVKFMGLKNPVGETVKWGKSEYFTVIGVVKDLVMQSPYEAARPMIFILNYDWTSIANIKIKPSKSASKALAKIETVFKKYDPDNLFEYKFVDREFAKKFGNEERIGKLAGFFALLAIFISGLGLFGLASF